MEHIDWSNFKGGYLNSPELYQNVVASEGESYEELCKEIVAKVRDKYPTEYADPNFWHNAPLLKKLTKWRKFVIWLNRGETNIWSAPWKPPEKEVYDSSEWTGRK